MISPGEDRIRSEYMRSLVKLAPAREAGSDLPRRIPMVVVQFWDDLARVPSDVAECMDSWSLLDARGFQRFVFEDSTARQFIAEHFDDRHTAAFGRCDHPAMRCDYFRLCFLARLGGFYVDADDRFRGANTDRLFRDDRLKLQPLCYDASTDSMIAPAVFADPENDSPHWIYYVNNNPIIAPAGHPIIRLALERATTLLLSGTHDRRDIQSTTGPGNLTASLVDWSGRGRGSATPCDFELLLDWELLAETRWPLSYRDDERNWRIWRHSH